LGGAVKGFKDGIKDSNAASDAAAPAAQVAQDTNAKATTIDVEAKQKS
jgi:sec-independent protein translocase protein TatA